MLSSICIDFNLYITGTPYFLLSDSKLRRAGNARPGHPDHLSIIQVEKAAFRGIPPVS
jgi:hypothetical protein